MQHYQKSSSLCQNCYVPLSRKPICPSCIPSCTEKATRHDLKIPVKEVSIPVSYGQIAAKVWGHEEGHPFIAVHGWMRHCEYFDKLIPLLDKSLYIVALDLPGCGRSSHKPTGCFYSCTDMIMAIKHTANFFGWKQFSLIGHSYGGSLVLLFSGMYPDLVQKVILLDKFYPNSLPAESIPEHIAETLDRCMELEKKITPSPPVYSETEALERFIKGHFEEIDEEMAKFLIQRSTRLSDSGTGLVFSRDLRILELRTYDVRCTETIKAFMRRIKSEMLIVQATNEIPSRKRDPEKTQESIDIFKQCSKRFVLEIVEGNHYVPQTHPERVAPVINKFISDKN